MTAEIKPKKTKKWLGMEMTESSRNTLAIKILVTFVIFDTVADFL
jgi:hypothetical protein|tara:strand:- start:210 stop:344 length:135 start_codon:yes stop_codon:yes gene_type:complete